MSGNERKLEQMLVDLLDVKNKHGLDNDNFLVLLGLVNLMGIINLLDGKPAQEKRGDDTRRVPPDKSPFMGMFTGPRNRNPVEEDK